MFKQLKNRMLYFNLSVFFVLLLIVFASLYITTYSNIREKNNQTLDRVLSINPNHGQDQLPPQNQTPTYSFSILIENDEIIDSMSNFTVDQDYIESIYDLVDSKEGTVEIDDRVFQYKQVDLVDRSIIGFVDITLDNELLNTTLIRYIIIFAITLLTTGLITNYITNRSIKPVKESYDKQKDFIANASHELKTPLTVINTNVDVLLSNSKYKDDKWLNYVKVEVERMNKLTKDLLYLAKTGEETELLKSNINISEKMESLLLGLEALTYEKQIKLDYQISPNVNVLFNDEQFTQVIMILLDNAIKYTPKNESINVNLETTSKHAYITVENTGTVISDEDLKLIFERFYKTDKSRKNSTNSFGLGLSIAKTIINNHRAKIYVESEESVVRFIVKINI